MGGFQPPAHGSETVPGVLPAVPRRERPGAPQTRRGAQAGPERESARTCRGVNVGAAACVQLFYTVSPDMDPSP